MNSQPVREDTDLQHHTDTDHAHSGSFQSRHIGPDPAARDQMLAAIGVPSLDALIEQTVPPDIRLPAPLDLPAGVTEYRVPAQPARHRCPQPRLQVVHRSRLLRLRHAGGDSPQRAGKSRLVHTLHAVPGRDRPGPPRIAPELSDDGAGSDGDGHRDGLALGRGDRRSRSDDHVPPAADARRPRPARKASSLSPSGASRRRSTCCAAARSRSTSSWSSATSPMCRRTC